MKNNPYAYKIVSYLMKWLCVTIAAASFFIALRRRRLLHRLLNGWNEERKSSSGDNKKLVKAQDVLMENEESQRIEGKSWRETNEEINDKGLLSWQELQPTTTPRWEKTYLREQITSENSLACGWSDVSLKRDQRLRLILRDPKSR